MQRQPTFERSALFIRPASTGTDTILIDPGTLGLAIDSDDDYQLRSALAVGTKAGNLSVLWSHPKSIDEVEFQHLWTVSFSDEGGISSVRSSPIIVDPPFVSFVLLLRTAEKLCTNFSLSIQLHNVGRQRNPRCLEIDKYEFPTSTPLYTPQRFCMVP
jgi:hypothetical protein